METANLHNEFVTVVMPIRNEADFIATSLGAVTNQDYTGKLEILVLDGLSTDSTQQIVAEMAGSDERIVLLNNPQHTVPYALNIALRQAKGSIVVRVDGHCEVASDYVRRCVEVLQETEADNVGGRMIAQSSSLFGKAVAVATSSPFGVGGARFHYSTKGQWVDTVYLGAWPRKTFEHIGLFDEEMVRNQDDEFNYRLRAAGGRIWLGPKIRSTYTPRASVRRLWKQYYQYGYWKVRVLQKHTLQMRPRQFVPFAFVMTLLASLLLPPLWPLAMIVGLLYLLANGAASFVLARRHGMRLLLGLLLAHSIIHVSYGLGFLVGLIRFAHRWGDKVGKVSTLPPITEHV